MGKGSNGKYWEYLRPWNKLSCENHYNILWRFDGQYLNSEVGNYLLWSSTEIKGSDYRSITLSSFFSKSSSNGKKILWEYDPKQKYLTSPGQPVWLTRSCTSNATSPSASPRCNGPLVHGPIKVDNPLTLKHNEKSEQLFTLDYQGKSY